MNVKGKFRLARRGRSDQGQAAFEFLLIFPFFILMVLLMIDFAILGFSYVSVANAAREGARFGAVNCGGADCTAAAVETRSIERSSGIVSDPASVNVSWPEGTDRGAPIAVEIDQTYEFLFFPFEFPLRSCSEMRLEQRDATAPAGGSGC